LSEAEHAGFLTVIELVEQGLDQSFGFGFLGEQFVRDRPQVGGSMVKAQALEAGGEAILWATRGLRVATELNDHAAKDDQNQSPPSGWRDCLPEDKFAKKLT
jgi:hypothetical protein